MQWLRLSTKFLGIFSLVFFAVPMAAQAQETETWHIDQGFIGRQIVLDVLDGRARLSWGVGDVLFPSEVWVSGSPDEVEIRWSTSYALGPKGIEIGLKPEMSFATTSDAWSGLAIESKEPFGPWKILESKIKNGYVVALVKAEARVRLALVPFGLRTGTATWYRHKGCLCAASPDFPKGTQLKISLADDPSKSVVVKVNDWGPDRGLFPKRVVDLDSVAFKRLSPLSRGKIEVLVEPLGLPLPAMFENLTKT
jgi:hypothetical protein